MNEMLEALYREYVTIKDHSLPIFENNNTSPELKVEVDKSYLEQVEIQADFRTYSLLMPQDKVQQSLLENNYDIDEVFRKYFHLEKSSVLHWIAVVSEIRQHFVRLFKESQEK